MRGWGVGTLTVLAFVAFAATPASAEICHMNAGGVNMEYQCPGGASSQKESTGPWYTDATFQAIIAIVGLVGSASAGGYALYRVRKRRQALTRHLAALERAYQEAKAQPGEGAQKVAQLQHDIQADHTKGRLDDGQYLELDKRAKEFLVRLRLLDVDIRFRNLPPAFLAELRHLVSDGVVSQAEADLIEHHAAAYALPEPTRSEIVKLARRWAGEDDPAAPKPTASIAARSVPVSEVDPNEPITARPRPKILSK